MKRGRLAVLLACFFLVCGTVGVVQANPANRVSEIIRTLTNPGSGGDGSRWLKAIMEEESLLEDDTTAVWLDSLSGRVENGEITRLELLDELTGKVVKEVNGARSKRHSKIAIRLIYSSAGVDPDIAKAFIREIDSRIDLSEYSDLYRTIDFSDIEIRPAKPYFEMTLDTLDNVSNAGLDAVAENMRMIALMSIDGGHARFNIVDYEAAALTRMDDLAPSAYERAIDSYRSLFNRGPNEPESLTPAYRVGIFSSPYFESARVTDRSRVGTKLVSGILDDVSRGHTKGFTETSVLKLWDFVRGDGNLKGAFQKAVREMILRSNLRPEGVELAGGSFTHSLMQAVKESEELQRLVMSEINRINDSVSPGVVF